MPRAYKKTLLLSIYTIYKENHEKKKTSALESKEEVQARTETKPVKRIALSSAVSLIRLPDVLLNRSLNSQTSFDSVSPARKKYHSLEKKASGYGFTKNPWWRSIKAE